MKKILLLASAALIGLGVQAQNLPANVGADQLSTVSPAPGKLNLSINTAGLMSMLFNIAEPNSSVNIGANVYAHLTRDGKVLANVQAGNYRQVSYDGVMDHVWQLSFFLDTTKEASMSGIYEVKFDEGFFLLGEDKTPSKEIDLYYLIEGADFVVSPEAGTVSSLKDFTMTFPGVKEIKVNQITDSETGELVDAKFRVYNIYGGDDNLDEGEEGAAAPEYNPAMTIEGNVIKLSLSETLTDPGVYWLSADANMFTFTYEDGSTRTAGDYLVVYNVPNLAAGLSWINPEPGETDMFPGTIYFEIDSSRKLMAVNEMGANYIYPAGQVGVRGKEIARYQARISEAYPNTVELVYYNNNLKAFDPGAMIIPAPGDYVLHTSEKLFGTLAPGETQIKWQSSMDLEYTVYVYDEVPTTFTPAEGTTNEEIKKISVRFDEAKTVEVVANSSSSWLSSETTNYLFGARKDAEDDKTVLFTTAVGATIPGTYKFTSAPGQVIVDGVSMVVTADYKIGQETGVGQFENVVVLPEIFDIYTTDGVLVKKAADVEYLLGLPAGVYIAGGKKFINH